MILTTLEFTTDLHRGTQMEVLHNAFMVGDQEAHRFVVALVNPEGGGTVSLTGAGVQGFFVRRGEDSTVVINGESDGNKAIVTLPAACYAVPGRFSFIMRVSMGDTVHSVLWCDGVISRSRTDTLIDPGDVVPTLDELLGRISVLEAVTEAASDIVVRDEEAAGSATVAAKEAVAAAATATEASTQAQSAATTSQNAALEAMDADQSARAAANRAADSEEEAAAYAKRAEAAADRAESSGGSGGGDGGVTMAQVTAEVESKIPKITDNTQTYHLLDASDIDATLAVVGKAADAAETGKAIAELTEEKIDKNGVDQVTKDNADFIGKAPGANLFNKDTMATVATWFAWESGTSGKGAKVIYAANQYTGQYAAIEIPITQSGNITIKMGSNVSLYAYYFVDDNNIATDVYATAIGASIADGYTMTAPNGAKKLLLSLLKYEQQLGYGNELMVNYGAEALAWEAYTERYVFTGVDVDDPRTIAMSSIVGNENNIVYIHMAEEYALVVGDTFELFYKGIISAVNPDIFDIRIICDKGNAFTKRYIWTPTDDDIGAHNLTVELYGINHNLLHTKTVKLVVKGKAPSPSSPINVLCVGDSLTAQGIWPAEVHRRLTASTGAPVGDSLSNINFIGSMSVGGVGYEGHAGWSITSYTTANNGENPFWDADGGKLDFAKYVANIGASGIDYLYLLIGWNDANKTQDVFKAAMHEFIIRVRLSYPNVKIVLMGLEIPARDGLGENYGAEGVYADYHGLMQYVFDHWKWINDFKGTFANTVSTLNIAGQFDTEHNMPTATRPVNARNAEIETYQNNGVHPANAGYMQIADAVYRDLTHKLQS